MTKPAWAVAIGIATVAIVQRTWLSLGIFLAVVIIMWLATKDER